MAVVDAGVGLKGAATKLAGSRCLCPTCGEMFGGLRAFDEHRTGQFKQGHARHTRRCLTPAEMEARGMERGAYGWNSRYARHMKGRV